MSGRRDVRLLMWVLACAACTGEVTSPIDAGTRIDAPIDIDSSVPSCDAGSCDDGVHCNGVETCAPSDPSAGSDGCVAGAPPCMTGQRCSEEERRCVNEVCIPPMDDMDGDGQASIDCGGTDCDDGDPLRSLGNTEICDPGDVDEDCDPTTFGVRDADSDGEPDAQCCNTQAAADPICGTDCDDTRAGVSPVATETCDERDNDCDGATDEGVLRTFYPDTDGDGFGDPAGTPLMGCSQPAMYAETASDCDDTRASVHVGAPEQCDEAELDHDCGGDGNNGCDCFDGMSRDCALPGVCLSGREACADGMFGACSIRPVTETCNGLDDNCDGTTDEGLTVVCYADADNDGYSASGAAATNECPDAGRPTLGGCPTFKTDRAPSGANLDCADMDASRRPGLAEICNGIDENCDGVIDEALRVACWADGDNDGYAPMSAAMTMQCPAPDRTGVGGCPLGMTNRMPATGAIDCDDGASSLRPGATEICVSGSAADEDCDGSVDEGVAVTCYSDTDGDGYAPSSAPSSQCRDAGRPTAGFCPILYTDRAPVDTNSIDCAPTDPAISPGGSETCDPERADEDCDGVANPIDLCTCTDGEVRSCGAGGALGECAGGTQSCSGGMWGTCSRLPAAMEVACDGRDEDCDGVVDNGVQVTCYTDADNDTYPAPDASAALVCPDAARTEVGGCPIGKTDRAPSGADVDCADMDLLRGPGRTERCNGVDDDCDDDIDEALRIACWTDTDNDTYPPMSPAMTMECPDTDPARAIVGGCPIRTTNRASGPADCNDAVASVSPTATEICNEVDDDCEGGVDEGSNPCGGVCALTNLGDGCDGSDTDLCLDDAYVCDVRDANATICSVGANNVEACGGGDEDCDSQIDEGYTCSPGNSMGCTICGRESTQTCGATCSWGSCTPLSETCNGCDDDLDSQIDDGYECASGSPPVACTVCGRSALRSCNGSTCTLSPCTLPEVCNSCDDDGDGLSDEVFACVRGSSQTCYVCGRPSTQMCNGSCNWGSCAPLPEIANGCDDDLDGSIDEGFSCANLIFWDDDNNMGCSSPDGVQANGTGPISVAGTPQTCTPSPGGADSRAQLTVTPTISCRPGGSIAVIMYDLTGCGVGATTYSWPCTGGTHHFNLNCRSWADRMASFSVLCPY